MLREEFAILTGYMPSVERYAEIERNYMAFDGDKQKFCKMWATVNASTVAEYKTLKEQTDKMADKMLELGVALDKIEKELEVLKKKRQQLIYLSRGLKVKLDEQKEELNRF